MSVEYNPDATSPPGTTPFTVNIKLDKKYKPDFREINCTVWALCDVLGMENKTPATPENPYELQLGFNTGIFTEMGLPGHEETPRPSTTPEGKRTLLHGPTQKFARNLEKFVLYSDVRTRHGSAYIYISDEDEEGFRPAVFYLVYGLTTNKPRDIQFRLQRVWAKDTQRGKVSGVLLVMQALGPETTTRVGRCFPFVTELVDALFLGFGTNPRHHCLHVLSFLQLQTTGCFLDHEFYAGWY